MLRSRSTSENGCLAFCNQTLCDGTLSRARVVCKKFRKVAVRVQLHEKKKGTVYSITSKLLTFFLQPDLVWICIIIGQNVVQKVWKLFQHQGQSQGSNPLCWSILHLLNHPTFLLLNRICRFIITLPVLPHTAHYPVCTCLSGITILVQLRVGCIFELLFANCLE